MTMHPPLLCQADTMQCQQTANVDCFKHAERDMKPKHDFRPHNMLYGTFLHVMTTRYQIMAHVIFNTTEEMVIKKDYKSTCLSVLSAIYN